MNVVSGVSYKKLPTICSIAVAMTVHCQPAIAQDMTAGVVMVKMKGADRFTYIAGIVEGLSHARYARDGNKPAGRSCINRWFYDDKSTINKIEAAFNRYPNAMPGQVVATLANVKCGA